MKAQPTYITTHALSCDSEGVRGANNKRQCWSHCGMCLSPTCASLTMKRLLGSLAWYCASCRSMAARRALFVPAKGEEGEGHLSCYGNNFLAYCGNSYASSCSTERKMVVWINSNNLQLLFGSNSLSI